MVGKNSSSVIRDYLKGGMTRLFHKSVRLAVKEQGLEKLAAELCELVPDITDQYTMFKVDTPYLNTKVRGVHAFQISLVRKIINEFTSPIIVDIGDSSGTHLQYINGLYNGKMKIKCLSVNLEGEAVRRIKGKELDAVCARAEDLHQYNISADVFLCFETLEHMMNPCYFLHELSSKTKAKYLIVTVPYVKKSRVGLHHIRNKIETDVSAENTHIFELNPEDWKLIVRHSGWDVVKEKIYLQYPGRGILRATKPLWKRFDFEGFYGMILRRDNAWSSRYTDW